MQQDAQVRVLLHPELTLSGTQIETSRSLRSEAELIKVLRVHARDEAAVDRAVATSNGSVVAIRQAGWRQQLRPGDTVRAIPDKPDQAREPQHAQ